MNVTSIRNRGKTRTALHRVSALALAAFMLLAVSAGVSFAAAPNAGTDIGNQATATYNDGPGGPSKQASSNTVTTRVQQVAGLTLTIDQTKSVAVGGTVYFLHTVTNTGNGSDTYNLSAAAQSGTLSLTTGIFADTGSGPGAALSPAQTATLARNASFTFYVGATASAGATASQTNTILITATSQFNAGVFATNTDTVNVSPFAVLNVLKFVSPGTGKSGDTATYTIRYTNNGNNNATLVTLTDTMPSQMTYVPGTARWTVTGATALTDATGDTQGTGPTIDYSFDGTAKKLTAVISQVNIGATADITFQVTVNPNLPPQVITNTAHYTYNNGSIVTTDASVSVDYTINTVRSVVIDDIGSTTDTPAVANDNVIVPSAAQGSVVWFDNVIHNTGNVADTYQMSITSNTFPAGTAVQYYDALNGGLLGGNVTGSVAANGGTYHVWVKVTLPMNAGGGGPYALVKKATSSNDGAISDTVTDTLTTIVAATVDITNNESLAANANAAGKGAGPEGSAVTTTTGSNTTPAVFSLYLNNTGLTPETFTLAYSATTTFSPAAALPSGWTVAFTAPVAGVCSTASIGAPLAGDTTAVIAGGANAQVCAVVTPPAGVAGGVTVQVYFKATGNSTGAADIKHDAVTTATAYAITLTPNNSGQIVPNGTKVYTHNLCNNSNVAVGKTAGDLLIATTGDLAGWSSNIYLDAGLTTILSDVHQYNAGAGIPAGTCVTIYVKVGAPAGPLGAVDTTTINVTSTKGVGAPKVVATATDTTTMQTAQLTIDKWQALDATCSAPTAGLTYTQGNLSAGANPGVCIRYKLVVNNNGNQQATLLSVTDALTPYTVYSKGIDCYTATTPPVIKSPLPGGLNGASGDINGTPIAAGSITEPAECASAGTVTFGPAGMDLNAGSIATLYFSVQIAK